MVDVMKLIAAVSPDVYCDPENREEVKKAIEDAIAGVRLNYNTKRPELSLRSFRFN